jgi:phosphopantetheinyl transferase (holo-ACP synthase)
LEVEKLSDDYTSIIWNGFDESFILDILEKIYEKMDYAVTNFHKADRPHEEGIDLLCEKGTEKIAIQTKVKPCKGDTGQFTRFLQNTKDKKRIYIYIKNPTKSFKDFAEVRKNDVEFWNSQKLHTFLVENESIDYCCLYFSKHPLISSFLKIHELIIQKRDTQYAKHKVTREELAKLWAAKDNSVKIWVSLNVIFLRWNKILMSKIEKERSEFNRILEMIKEDLDMAYNLSGEKFVASIEDLSERHPDLIGLMWKLASQRTNWIRYTVFVDKSNSESKSLFFTLYSWICLLFNKSKRTSMSGFYSSMNYLLENFQEVAKNLEYAIDWVFASITKT